MGEITFEDLIQHGRDNGGNIQNGMPWSFNFSGLYVTHERDDCYILTSKTGETWRIHPGEVLQVSENGVYILPSPIPENLFTPNKIRTFTGKYINPLDPDPELICIEDIAHALSMQCRFGGHTKIFYSVAEHSMAVAKRLLHSEMLAGLLHDAAEAYLIDLPAPIKSQLPGYKEAENQIMDVIAEKYDFKLQLNDRIKAADMAELIFEWEAFVVCKEPPHYTAAHSPRIAKAKFLEMFYDLI